MPLTLNLFHRLCSPCWWAQYFIYPGNLTSSTYSMPTPSSTCHIGSWACGASSQVAKRKWVHGTALMLEEEEVVDQTLDFLGGDNKIIECVTWEVQDNNNDKESDSDDEVEDTEKQITKPSKALDLCAHSGSHGAAVSQIFCIQYCCPRPSNSTVQTLRTFLSTWWPVSCSSFPGPLLDCCPRCWHGLVFFSWSCSILYCI
jgi:hypothetical protein